MKSFTEAVEKLGTRNSRKLANNTYLEKQPDGTIAVRLHSTNVVIYSPDGTITLNSGGWRTPTTKDRINTYSPLLVSQERGIWYVGKTYWDKAATFADGLTYKDGVISGAGEAPKKQEALRKRVQKFARTYIQKLGAGEIPAPSGGDCWLCLGKMSGDHILSHIDEGYYVPTLIVNAFKDLGAAPVQMWGLQEIWGQLPEASESKTQARFTQWATDVRSRRMLTRYLYRQLGLAA